MNGKGGKFQNIKFFVLMSFTIHLQVKSCTLYNITYDQKYKGMIE